MKKLHQILLLAMSFVAWSVGAAAQERTVEIVKDGQVVFSIPAREIEYMTIVDRLHAPENVRGSVADGQVTVTWDAVDGATSYQVFRSTDGNNFSLLGTSSGTSFADNAPLPGTNYYYRVQALHKNGIHSDMSATLQLIVGGVHNGLEYVDLGLPSGIKWATRNVGAYSPSSFGNYYAWGETRSKATYTEGNCVTNYRSFGNISGNPQYDAARYNWRGNWRLPSQAEWNELVDQCIWTWTSEDGQNGYKVTGPNGNSIFLPAAGSYFESWFNGGDYGSYWSSTPYAGTTLYAYYLNFGSGYHEVTWGDRFRGRVVRPVFE